MELIGPSLARFIGKQSARRYYIITVVLYFLILGVSLYLYLDSTNSAIDILINEGQDFAQDNGDESSGIGSLGVISAIVSTIIIRYIIYIEEVGFNPKGVLYVSGLSFTSSIVTFLYSIVWAFAILIIAIPIYVVGSLALTNVGATDQTIWLFVGVYSQSGLVLGCGFAAVWVVLRTEKIFPEDFRESISDFNDDYSGLAELKEEVKSKIATKDSKAAASQLIDLQNEYQRYNPPDELPDHAQTKLEELEDAYQDLAKSLCEQLLDEVRDAIDTNRIIDAHSQLSVVEVLAAEFDVSNSRIASQRSVVDDELQVLAASSESKIREKLQEANTALEQNQYEEAEDYISEASKTFNNLREIPKADAPAELHQTIAETRSALKTERESDQIQEQKMALSKTLDIDPSEINITDESIQRYETLSDVVSGIQAAKSNFGRYPWESLEEVVLENISNLKVEDLRDYNSTVTDSIAILEFLSTVNESHPSIDGEGWREAVRTALKDQYPDILSPIIQQINRLETGLWKQNQLIDLSWEEFEELIGSFYETRGYEVEVTQGSADLGVDVWAERAGERIAVQVKQYGDGNTVGRETLQKLASNIAKGDADKVVVVTSGNFARTAEQYAEDFGPNLQLIDGEELIQMLSESEIPPVI